MQVTIQQSDIDNSRPGDCLRDVVATALRRLTGQQWRVDLPYCFPVGQQPYLLPKAAVRLIEAQDNGQPIRPTSFELRR